MTKIAGSARAWAPPTGTLAVVALLAVFALAPPVWAASTNGAMLSLQPGTAAMLAFKPTAIQVPDKHRAAEVVPHPSAPFTLTVLMTGPGTYDLRVGLASDIVAVKAPWTVPAGAIRYKVTPVGRHPPQGCVGGPWQAVGTGSRVAVMQGPGVCRLAVSLRWAWTAREVAGHYRGVLTWTLSSASQ